MPKQREHARVFTKLVRLERDGAEFSWAIATDDGEKLEGKATLGLLIAVFSRLLEMFALGAPIIPFPKPKESRGPSH